MSHFKTKIYVQRIEHLEHPVIKDIINIKYLNTTGDVEDWGLKICTCKHRYQDIIRYNFPKATLSPNVASVFSVSLYSVVIKPLMCWFFLPLFPAICRVNDFHVDFTHVWLLVTTLSVLESALICGSFCVIHRLRIRDKSCQSCFYGVLRVSISDLQLIYNPVFKHHALGTTDTQQRWLVQPNPPFDESTVLRFLTELKALAHRGTFRTCHYITPETIVS